MSSFLPPVQISTWQHLYTAALQFQDLKPWDLLGEEDLFGVQNPLTGEIGYCCILGGDEFFGLIVYPGSAGLKTYQKIYGEGGDPLSDLNFLVEQNCLSAEFVRRSELDPDDLKVIKKLKLKTSRSSRYPVFRSYTPKYAPWFLSEDQAGFLTLCLEKASELIQQYDGNPGLFDAADPTSHLVFVPNRTSKLEHRWTLEWKRPAPLATPVPPSIQHYELQIKRIQKSIFSRQGEWEADYFTVPTLVDEGARPFFASASIVAERESGMVLETIANSPETSSSEAIVAVILKGIENRKSLPSRICVPNIQLQSDLQELGLRLGIPIFCRKNLPMISYFKESLISTAMGEGNSDDEDLDHWSELDLLERTESDQIH